MIPLRTRARIKALLNSGAPRDSVAAAHGVSMRTVARIAAEPEYAEDEESERRRRGIGRPALTQPYRPVVESLLEARPPMKTASVLQLMQMLGYTGHKTAAYELVRAVRGKRR